MKVKIWSDIRCPFCYIGKHKFEKALSTFPYKEKIEVEWHSFELDPELQTNARTNTCEHLAESKGISVQEAKDMSQYVKEAAKGFDIRFDFDRVVIANSFNAHRLIHFSKNKGLENEVAESLFKAHFSQGKNIDDSDTLIEIACALGISKAETKAMLGSGKYNEEVLADEKEAGYLGIRGVPFFVFNDKYAVSGAQQPGVFSQVLYQCMKEYSQSDNREITENGDTCDVTGNCK